MLELYCLPDEILVEIFSRLPIKSLIICSSTCKWLLSLISSSSFMVSQMKIFGNKNPLIFLKYYTESTKKEYFGLHPDDESFTGDFELNSMPIRYPGGMRYFAVVGCCNGVICLSDDVSNIGSNIFLWNPSIRKMVTLPRAEISWGEGKYGDISDGFWFGLGFGFDSREYDFKVVRLVYQCIMTKTSKDCPVVQVQVYSLKLNSWRVVQSSIDWKYKLYNYAYKQCFVNGAVHWLGQSDSVGRVIVAFDLEGERFRVMNMPLCTDDGNQKIPDVLMLGKSEGRLSLIKVACKTLDYWSMWIMREYGEEDSWCEVFRIVQLGGYPKPRAFSFRNDENMVVLVSSDIYFDHDGRHLMLLVKRDGCVIKVLSMIDADTFSCYLDTYVESLALFKEGKQCWI